MKIVIETIPHAKQRYDTVGDYYVDEDGTRHILVSDMRNDDYEFFVGIHEAAEQHLCLKNGVPEKDITKFDIWYEKNNIGPPGEPGDDPRAPYHNEHCFATAIERLMVAARGIKWARYEKAVNKLFNK